jgi:hypothetical protein
VGELEKFTGIQFDPEIVPVLVGLDRDILDRPPDRPDELPTMLHADDPRDRPEPDKKQDRDTGKAASVTSDASVADDRKSNAAPGTAIKPMQRSSRVTKAPSGRKGSPPRQALASDDVP